MSRVTDADRAHFRRIAVASEKLDRERRKEAALESPGDKMLAALKFSTLLLQGGHAVLEPRRKSFSLSARWRAVRGEQRRGRVGS